MSGVAGPVLLTGFPPVVGTTPRLLILGSMPSVASLAAAEYYGHPRNAFWPIMGELFGAGPELPYAQRTQRLAAAGVALWDVLRHCRRHGSLDSAIERDRQTANAVPELLARHPSLDAIALNGGRAATLFRRHLEADVIELRPRLKIHRLPSTSPAHAARNFEQKLAAWRVLIRDVSRPR